jgi:uncharacterized protein YgiM (DUF1202 family)
MTLKDAITWFKKNFNANLQSSVKNTPYSIDLLCAMAYQETGYIWSSMAGKLTIKEIAMLAVGDTLDSRSVFPRSKAELLSQPNGATMFAIARESLVNMAKYVNGYNGAVKNPNKFCHGYGIFQYDIQFFKTDPEYFLKKKWADIDACFGKCINELNGAKKRQGWQSKTTLTDEEKVYVAIAYNKGSANLSKGFKQGFQSDDKKFYGENIFEYMRVSQSIATNNNAVSNTAPAPLPEPTPVISDKKIYSVKVTATGLNLRSEPKIPKDNPRSNIRASLPNGHEVTWVSGNVTDKWVEVETNLNGAYFKGFVSPEFLVAVKKIAPNKPALVTRGFAMPPAAASSAVNNIPAVYMPRNPGLITKRSEAANAFSLNEPGQPSRKVTATEPSVLKQSLLEIVNWINVQKSSNKRYQPGNNSTFCNIYAHDYCHLAGVYFPRVWWTSKALMGLARNETVKPLYGNTIQEMRANDLLRWLKDFGEIFGWRQTGDLNKLQNAANIGGVALIIARRIEEGRSGHVTIVIPEGTTSAKRDANGLVTAPLQSQAGSTNFNMGTGKPGWWLGAQFAEHAFWIHG